MYTMTPPVNHGRRRGNVVMTSLRMRASKAAVAVSWKLVSNERKRLLRVSTMTHQYDQRIKYFREACLYFCAGACSNMAQDESCDALAMSGQCGSDAVRESCVQSCRLCESAQIRNAATTTAEPKTTTAEPTTTTAEPTTTTAEPTTMTAEPTTTTAESTTVLSEEQGKS